VLDLGGAVSEDCYVEHMFPLIGADRSEVSDRRSLIKAD